MVAKVVVLVAVVVSHTVGVGQAVSTHRQEKDCIQTRSGKGTVPLPSLCPLYFRTATAGTLAVYPSDMDGKPYGGGTSATTPQCQPGEWGKVLFTPTSAQFSQVEFRLCGGGSVTGNISMIEDLVLARVTVWTDIPVEWNTCAPDSATAPVEMLGVATAGWVTAAVLAVVVVALAVYSRIPQRIGNFLRLLKGLECQNKSEVPLDQLAVSHLPPPRPESHTVVPQPQPAVVQPSLAVQVAPTTPPESPSAVLEPLAPVSQPLLANKEAQNP